MHTAAGTRATGKATERGLVLFTAFTGLALTISAAIADAANPTMTALEAASSATAFEERALVLRRASKVKSLQRVNPKYPLSAARDGVEDVVTLRLFVGADGKPRDVVVVDSERRTSTQKQIERAAVAAVQQWTFNPATVEGEPVDSPDHIVRIAFRLRETQADISRRFAGRYRKADELVKAGQYAEAAEVIEEMKEKTARSVGEKALTSLLEATVHQKTGDLRQAVLAAERAEALVDPEDFPAAFVMAAGGAMQLNAALGDYQAALGNYEDLTQPVMHLEEDDPLHAMAARMRSAIAGTEPLETEAQITPCGERCAAPVDHFVQGLNRDRFTIEPVSGVIRDMTIRCESGFVTLAWAPEVVWSIENDAEDCWITVTGEADTTFRLIELPALAGEASSAP